MSSKVSQPIQVQKVSDWISEKILKSMNEVVSIIVLVANILH